MSRPDPVLGERLARHGFADRPAQTVVDAVRLTTAVQSQDPIAGRLGVRSRSATCSDADVQRAIDVDRTVVKTTVMRATIHLVAAEDVRWLTALTGPGIARSFRTRWAGLGLDVALLERAAAAIPDVLGGEPATRAEILDRLDDRGVHVDRSDPAAATHVLLAATTQGLVCRGPDRRRDATFVLLDEWLPGGPAGPSGDDALAELARRYFAAFSPATAADFTTWSGLPSSRAIGLIRDELTPVDVHGRAGYRLGEVEPATGVRLLSGFDNYLVGYRHREFITNERRPEVYVGGLIRPALLVDGRIAGRWQLVRAGAGYTVEVIPFETFTPKLRRAVEDEVADITRFLT